jgi:type II secretory pathway component PulF
MPIEIQAAAPVPDAESEPTSFANREIHFGRQRVTHKDRIFFTERLALLLETGNALHTSLEILEDQSDGDALRKVVLALSEDVSGGLSFSQALARHPEAFPPSYVSVVEAGEQGGFLHEVLERLRELDEKRQELHSTLFSAFSYPAFLVVFSVAVVTFVLMVVFPKFGDLFTMIWDKLPITTRFLMTVSQILSSYWHVMLLGIGAMGMGAWRWLSRPEGRATVESWLLRLPLLREIVVTFQLVQFMYVMSLSLGNGVTMLDALRSSREVVGSLAFQSWVQSLETNVTEGRGLSVGFEEADFVPPLITQMVTTGEETGSLAMVMGRMAAFYEREWKTRLTVMAKLVEPVMLVVMGLVVGLIVSSLILPIFKLSTTVR